MDGTEGDGPVPVVAQTLELTKFKTKTEAKACAQRFDSYAAQARREGKTKDAFRAVVVEKRIQVECDYGDGEWQPSG